MKVGDLVEVRGDRTTGPAVIVTLDEPTVGRAYQLAQIEFCATGERKEYVTTVLEILQTGKHE